MAISTSGLAAKYKKMTQYEHIIKRPDTYIGSVKAESDKQYIINNDASSVIIQEKEIENIQGLYKIFDEIIVNAIDNKNRIDNKIASGERGLKPMTTLEVNFTRKKIGALNSEKWCIEVKNDGEGIDVEMHPSENVWIPDMIFGQLLTSSNYNDSEKKITGGKNGFGAKLTNIYSHYFRVETVDRIRKRLYTKEYFDRMMATNDAKIKEKYRSKPYTSITFIPYYEAFGLEDLTDDLIALFKKRVYDMIYCSYGTVNVILDGVELFSGAASKPAEYIKMYNKDNIPVFECTPHPRWMVSACLSTDFQFRHISFVNGIYTCRGGKHVDYVSKKICKALAIHIKKKKKIDINEKFVKDNLLIFVNSLIENPDFDGQTKETLKTPATRFGSSFELPDSFINKIASNSGIVERALAQNSFQDSQLLSKTDGKKSRSLHIEKLDDAEYAGTAKSLQCTLILTEGDSAKAMAVAGISVVEKGGKLFGIFPLKGKLLNTRDKAGKDIAKNEEIANIKKIIGLRENLDYSIEKNMETLRYGRVMIMTDQDVDGSHIKGLLINYFEHNFPSLIQNNRFIVSLATPIIKVWKNKGGKKTGLKNFYDLPTFNKWLAANNNGKGWNHKYYKGLGTSTKAEAKEYFQNPKVLEFVWDKQASETVDMAFNSKRADDRKAWLNAYMNNTEENALVDINNPEISYSDFINKELVLFSLYDNKRSLPNIIDGLKPGQRKILFSCFKRNLVNEIKVAQLSGYVAEHSAYHHGEISLAGTIVGMAQDFPGSNNINLLAPNGQFGTRLEGGKDSASTRYIFTALEPITNIIYNKHDMALYNYLEDDGLKIEPICYAPIIPMLLVNGALGIGTGWSCSIPQFNPEDIVYNLRQSLMGKPSKHRELTPWYRGYKGSITKLNKNTWISRGCYKPLDDKTVLITELPIGMWTNNYKSHLISMINNSTSVSGKTTKRSSSSKKTEKVKLLKDYSVHPCDTTVHITLKLEPDVLNDILTKTDKDGISVFEKEFKLTSKITAGVKSLNCFNAPDLANNSVLGHYKDVESIFQTFFDYRLEMYIRRKEYLLSELARIHKLANYKMKFILGFINDEIKLKNVPQDEIHTQLESMNFPHSINGGQLVFPDNPEYTNGDFGYLLNLRISTLTREKVEELRKENEQIEIEISELKSKTAEQLWLDDLDKFDEAYKAHMKKYYIANELNPKEYATKVIKPIKLSLKKKPTVASK
jgi:DNA topoisomerase-2